MLYVHYACMLMSYYAPYHTHSLSVNKKLTQQGKTDKRYVEDQMTSPVTCSKLHAEVGITVEC